MHTFIPALGRQWQADMWQFEANLISTVSYVSITVSTKQTNKRKSDKQDPKQHLQKY